jgi:hypothetical protein
MIIKEAVLDDTIYSRLLKNPTILAELIPSSANKVFIVEIQRIPQLLNEVHRPIENRRFRFLYFSDDASEEIRNRVFSSNSGLVL